MVFDYNFSLPPDSISSIVRIQYNRSVIVTPWALKKGIARGWSAGGWQLLLPTADPAKISAVLERNAPSILRTLNILSSQDATLSEQVTALVWSEADLIAAVSSQ
jgi:hypothetical protein